MITKNKDLTAFNTFGVPSVAEQYVYLERIADLDKLGLTESPELVLGSGSNLLLLERIEGLTLHVGISGIQTIKEFDRTGSSALPFDSPQRIVRVGAGVNWQQFVLYALEKGWHGLENLALIPGTVGAAPVQNIGAYGVEVAEIIDAVHVYEYGKGHQVIKAKDCSFAYRNSRFKEEPGRYLITAVDFQLGGQFKKNVSYGAIKDRLNELGGVDNAGPQQIARAVMEIRAKKLPFYSQLGNSGSFFKNPIVGKEIYNKLLLEYPELPGYPLTDQHLVKLPAGWLIDQAGWRGKRIGNAGCYQHQALVIVNHGGATGKEILSFSEEVQASVKTKFGVLLEREVTLRG